jgi:Amidohydrolase
MLSFELWNSSLKSNKSIAKTKSKTMSKKYFFDVHMHAFNLSHPNLTAFLNRVEINKLLTVNSVFGSIIGLYLKLTAGDKIKKIKNLLSLMDNDIGSMFLILEHELIHSSLYVDGKINIAGVSYDKIILTPMIIDFGYKGKNKNIGIAYNRPPQKPIRSQINDLFAGIRFYLQNELTEVTKDGEKALKTKALPTADVLNNKAQKLFEIYPFMGINPDLYKPEKFNKIIDKYFDKYEANHQKFYNEYGNHPANVDQLKEFSFLGIKLYPPLGFNPGKLSSNFTYLLDKAIEKNVPIMVHCSDGGFLVKKEFSQFSSPNQWANILGCKDYHKLKVCFAHFASQSQKRLLFFKKRDWEEKLFSFISSPELNVFTDISCVATDKKFYDHLLLSLQKYPGLKDKLLFGTDFSINLLWANSYSEYYKIFSENLGNTHAELAQTFASVNPQKYLFNEISE